MKYYSIQITRIVLKEGEKVFGSNPMEIAEYAKENCYSPQDEWREQSFLIFVNNARQIEGHFLLGVGGFDSVTMDKRLACVAMLGAQAASAVLVHNHPAGNPTPGRSDIQMTGEIKNAFSAIGCKLLDHVIIGEDSVYSFLEEKIIPLKKNKKKQS